MAYLFVYGSLLEQMNNPLADFLSEQSENICNGYIRGRLYEINGYPGAITSNNHSDKVVGAILRLKAEASVFEALDEYEEVGGQFPQPNEYRRELVKAYCNNGQTCDCWVYIYNHPVDPLKYISTGDYWQFINQSE